MNTQITKAQPKSDKPSALKLMAAKLNIDPDRLFSILKNTVFQKANDDELGALVLVANEYSLNPLLKEIYAFPAKGGGIVPIVSVDGWNKMLLRQESFDGIEFEFQQSDDGKPVTCTATVFIKNRSHPVKLTEYFAECYRNTDPWNNMPHRMLRNRTLCQAARLAFGFAGVYDPDEAIDVQAAVIPDKPLKAIKGAEAQAGESSAAVRTPQQDLEQVVIEGGFTFDQFRQWAIATEALKGADSLGTFDEVPKDEAIRLLRAKSGLLLGLKGATTI